MASWTVGSRRVLIAALLLAALGQPSRSERTLAPWPQRASRAIGRRARQGSRWSWRSAAMLVGSVGTFGDAQHHNAFDKLDANQDGKVDRAEYMLHHRDVLNRKVRREDDGIRDEVYNIANEIWDACDIDGDGVLSRDEMDFASHFVERRLDSIQQGDTALPLWNRLGNDEGKAYLSLYDTNQNGVIERHEFRAVWPELVSAYGWDPSEAVDTPAKAEWIEGFFDSADLTGNDVLDSLELRYAAFLITSALLDQSTALLFRLVDSDGNKRIDEGEVDRAIRAMSEPGHASLSAVMAVKGAFPYADRDGDSSLDYTEARALMRKIMDVQIEAD